MIKKRYLKQCGAMAAVLAVTLMLSACGDEKKGDSSGSLEKGTVSYPISTEESLKVWKPLNGNVAAQVTSENELPFAKKLSERTGIAVEYIHPPVGQETEKFNIMIASGELPDIVEQVLSSTNEGVDGMINGGYVKELTPEFLQNYAPNFWKKVQEDKELNKWVVSNSGKYYGFPGYREADNMTVFMGLMIRDDLLKELGLETPETIDEWHTVLTAFRNNGVANPLSFTGINSIFGNGAFAGAFGVKMDFYIDNGVVKYGPLESGFKDFLQTMNAWYKEGLIDKNFASMKQDELDSKILNGATGATFGIVGSGMGKWLAAKDGDDSFSLAAVPYPSKEKGKLSEFGYKDSKYNEPKWWISGVCKNPELAARFLDYGYSEEGHMYYNFGEEGTSYTIKDGVPTYTELITNNPDGLSATQALTMHTHASYLGPYQMDERFFKQQYIYEEQRNALDVWPRTNAAKHYLSGAIAISSDSNSEYSKIMTDITTYLGEMVTKYIMGLEDLSTFDNFTARLKEMKIERAIQIKQEGYDAFNSR